MRQSAAIVITTAKLQYTGSCVYFRDHCARSDLEISCFLSVQTLSDPRAWCLGVVCIRLTVIDGQPLLYHRIPILNALRQTPKGISFCFFITAEVPVNYAIKVSINGGDEFDTRDRIMNSSKDIVCKLISHIPVIMVTLGDKGLLVCIICICKMYYYIMYMDLWTRKTHSPKGRSRVKKNTKKKPNNNLLWYKYLNDLFLVSRQLASRQSDDTISLVHYPSQKVETPVSVSGAGDWYVP